MFPSSGTNYLMQTAGPETHLHSTEFCRRATIWVSTAPIVRAKSSTRRALLRTPATSLGCVQAPPPLFCQFNTLLKTHKIQGSAITFIIRVLL